MNSIRKWFYRPRREDPSKLVQFYYADEELNLIAAELDSFDGHKDPDRCSTLVNQLRLCQDKVLNICNEIMDEAIPELRANRDYCIKFPDEMLHENLAGQLWFGAECLAAGSNVANREEESKEIRPLAKAVTKALDDVRNLLRDHCLRNCQVYSEKLKDSLEIFDKLFAEFELRYVAIMVPIKTLKECHLQQEIVVLFSETLQRALEIDLVTQDMIDDCDPSLMFAVPRLAIVCGLIIFTDGPLNLDHGCMEMSDLFKPFYSTLCEIRELLWTLSSTELSLLENSLCSAGEFQAETSVTAAYPSHKYQNYVDLFFQNYQSCQQFIQDFYGCHVSILQPDQNFLASGSISETWQTKEPDSNQECLTSSCSSLQNTSNCALAGSVDGSCTKAVHYTDTTHPYIPSDCLSVDVTQTNSTENSAQSTNSVNASSSHVNTYSESDNFCNNRTRYAELEQNVECLTWSTEDTPHLHGPKETRCEGESSTNCQATSNAIRERDCTDDCQEKNDVTASYDSRGYTQRSFERKITRMISTQSPDNCSDIAGNSWGHSPLLDDIYDATDSIDDEAIALALQAAEIASRNEARSNYKTSEELIHKLFVEISGVADQLQTNCASDLRNILKSVFNMNSVNSNVPDVSTSFNCNGTGSEENSSDEDVAEDRHNVTEEIPEISAINVLIPNEEHDGGSIDSAEEAVPESLFCETTEQQVLDFTGEPPCWIPDEDADQCMSCYAHFTLLRRRHHCRSCGKIFCSRCSSYSISLPHYGHQKPVRVCHRCFIHQVTPYVVSQRCSTCPPL